MLIDGFLTLEVNLPRAAMPGLAHMTLLTQVLHAPMPNTVVGLWLASQPVVCSACSTSGNAVQVISSGMLLWIWELSCPS